MRAGGNTGRLWNGGCDVKWSEVGGAWWRWQMMALKQQLMEVVASLPDDCTMDEFRHRLSMREKMAEAMRAIEEGRVHSHEETVEIVKSWRKLSGPTQP